MFSIVTIFMFIIMTIITTSKRLIQTRFLSIILFIRGSIFLRIIHEIKFIQKFFTTRRPITTWMTLISIFIHTI